MRLLRRNVVTGVQFTRDLTDAELDIYPYAVLSHRWGPEEEELTYEDVLRGVATDKPGIGAQKLRFCLERMREDGIEYFWIDTCCIDKRSSTELSKALISMYRWYAAAEKCYVFLSDVPASPPELSDRGVAVEASDGLSLRDASQAEEAALQTWTPLALGTPSGCATSLSLGAALTNDIRSSGWFKRGWTLQELIAPAVVEFYSRDGALLGTKSSLEKLVNELTCIPVEALRGEAMTRFSVHERQQWQEGRVTREPEDIIYSLFGLLDVSMPVLYGEGREEAQARMERCIGEQGSRQQDYSLVFSLGQNAIASPHFLARGQELTDIAGKLSSDGSRKILILHGLGGVGKTQLAIAYARRWRARYTAILWLDVRSQETVNASFINAARQILRDQPHATQFEGLDLSKDSDAVINAVQMWLSAPRNTRWLIICDNLDTPKLHGVQNAEAVDLLSFLPDAQQGSVLVTSRSSELRFGQCMRVGKLASHHDSLMLLERTSGRTELDKDVSASQLVSKLDGLPLALTSAGAYLNESTVTFAEYLTYLEESWSTLQLQAPSLTEYGNRSLYSTWQISYDQILERNPLSAQVLKLWAYLDGQDLWYELLKQINNDVYPWIGALTSSRLHFDAAMQVLCKYGLAEVNARHDARVGSRGYSVHPCVHSWTISVLNETFDQDLARLAIQCTAALVPPKSAATWAPMQRRLIPHIKRCTGYIATTESYASLATACALLGDLGDGQGLFEQREILYKRAVREQEAVYGAEHAEASISVRNLAWLYATHHQHTYAEALARQALEGLTRTLGADHRDTLHCAGMVASLYLSQSKYGRAEEMFLTIKECEERTLGLEHTSTLHTMSDYATLLRQTCRYDAAEAMFLQVIRGYETAVGPEHHWPLQATYGLANLLFSMGRNQESEALSRKALAGLEKVCGPVDVSTINVVNNLSNLYANIGRLQEAETMALRAIKGYETIYGPKHTDTLTAVSNLGIVYTKQGKYKDAKVMFERALHGQELTAGNETPTMALSDSVYNLGALYAREYDWCCAVKMFERALRGYETILASSPDHEAIIRTVDRLSLAYEKTARHQEAETMYRRALSCYARIHGSGHPSTLRAGVNFGYLLVDQERVEEAAEYHEAGRSRYDELDRQTQSTIDQLGRLIEICKGEVRRRALQEEAREVLPLFEQTTTAAASRTICKSVITSGKRSSICSPDTTSASMIQRWALLKLPGTMQLILPLLWSLLILLSVRWLIRSQIE